MEGARRVHDRSRPDGAAREGPGGECYAARSVVGQRRWGGEGNRDVPKLGVVRCILITSTSLSSSLFTPPTTPPNRVLSRALYALLAASG